MNKKRLVMMSIFLISISFIVLLLSMAVVRTYMPAEQTYSIISAAPKGLQEEHRKLIIETRDKYYRDIR